MWGKYRLGGGGGWLGGPQMYEHIYRFTVSRESHSLCLFALCNLSQLSPRVVG